jgi:hypothetical protein
MVKAIPQQGMSDDDYEKVIRTESANGGQMCALANYATNCAPQCSQASKNYAGCFSCLSNPASCGQLSQNNVQVACCPLMGPATTCNNCLGLYSVNALAICLQTGLTPAQIAGITIGVILGVVLIGVIVGVVYRTRKQATARHKLHLDEVELGNVDYEKAEQASKSSRF